MEIRIKTFFETSVPGIWCVVPTLLIYKRACCLAIGLTWLKWQGILAITVPNAKKH